MNTRMRRDTDDEIYIYINEDNEVLKWNWKNMAFEEEKYVVYVEELQYCCIAFCAFIIVFFLL